MSITDKLKRYKGKNIHIVGIGGAEGSAIAEFLVMNGIFSITGHDFSSKSDFKKSFYNTHLSLKPKEREEALNHLLNLPIRINFKDHYLEEIEKADVIFVSQVWFKYPQNMPTLARLKDSGVLFKTITNLYFELAPCPIISVTGTNGKTTTSRLINSIFKVWEKKNGKSKVYFAGNDRQNIQVLDKLDEMTKGDVLILETSSTQLLLNDGISPYIGIITNITPNHIDDHGSFENYIEAKKNLIRCQKKGDITVLNYDNPVTRKIAAEIESGRKSKLEGPSLFLYSAKRELEQGCFVRDKNIIAKRGNKETILLSVDGIKIPGAHNLQNVLAAASAAFVYGIDAEIIRKGVSNYTGTKHRLRLLYNIDGVKYYDDTQATTPEATIAGIESFDEDIILLAGGDNKGMKYERLAKKINDKVKFLILFGGSASCEIEKFVDKSKVGFRKVDNFSQAADFLKKYLRNKKTTGVALGTKHLGVVLISPGAAHFYSKFVENSGKDLKGWIRDIALSCRQQGA